MKNEIIREYRVKKNDTLCSNRTRPALDFKCFRCGQIISIMKSSYKENEPCESCRKHIRAEKRFFEEARKKYGDKFDLSQVKYVDSKTKVLVRCIKHDNSYWIQPSVFIGKGYPEHGVPHKGGCKLCAIEASKEYLHKPIEHYLDTLKTRFPHFSVVKHGEALSNREDIVLNCPLHGEFTTKLSDIRKAVYLCPHCSNEWLQWRAGWASIEQPSRVYLMYLPSLHLWKLGATHRTALRRSYELGVKAEIVWTIELDNLADAFYVEMYLFRKYWKYRCSNNSLKNGYTELLNIEIPKPTERFIEEILCLKESNSEEILTSNVEDNSEPSLYEEGATTISKESTLQADGSGKGSSLTA